MSEQLKNMLLNETINPDILEASRNPALEKTQERNLLSSAGKYTAQLPIAIGAGVANVAGETADFAGDMGIIAMDLVSRGYVAAVSNIDVPEELHQESMLAQQRAVQSITEYAKSDDIENEPFYNGVKDITESAVRFATIYKTLGKTALGPVAKSIISGAGEGAIDDPDQQINLAYSGLRASVARLAPNELESFDKAMSPETDAFVARQLIRRITNGVDMAALAAVGEGAIKVGGSAVKAIPKQYKDGVIDVFDKTMRKARVLREDLRERLGAAKSQAAKFEIMDGVAEDVVKVIPDAYDPKLTAKENLGRMIGVDFDSTGVIKDADHYLDKVTSFEKKLESLAPEIEAEIVKLSKARGVAKRELLDEFAKDIGIAEAKREKTKGLAQVLRSQAHNILVEQEGLKFGLAARNFQKGVINEKQYLDQFNSFLTATTQRATSLTGAGRQLRTAQELAPGLKGILDNLDLDAKRLSKIMDTLGEGVNNTEQLKFLADKTAQGLKIKQALDLDEDAFTVALFKSLDGADTLEQAGKRIPTVLNVLKDIPEFTGRQTQANLLTGTATIIQNTVGTAMMQGLNLSEAYIKAGLNGFGGQSMRDANALLGGLMYGYYAGIKNLVQSMPKKIHKGTGNPISYTTRYKQSMADLPVFDKGTARDLMNLDKTELAGYAANTGNMIYDSLNDTFKKRLLTGGWSFDVISMQDSLAKGAYAYGAARRNVSRALYADDIFGVTQGLVDMPTAKKLAAKMLLRGGDGVGIDDLRAAGYDDKAAIQLLDNIDAWRQASTEGAFNEAVDTVFQRPLTGGLGATREFLQEKLPFGRTLVPFFTTPVRILDESLQRMPYIPMGESAFGLPIHPKIYKDLASGGKAKEEAVAKIISGNMIALLGQRLAEEELYQPVQKDVGMNAYLTETYGLMPGSLVFNNKSYSTNFLGPIHNLLNAGASRVNQEAIYQKIAHEDPAVEQAFYDTLTYNTMNLSALIMEQPWAAGLDKIAELFGFLEIDVEDEAQKRQFAERAERFFGQAVGNLAPSSSLQRTISNNFMDQRRRAEGMVEHMLGQFAPYLLENGAYDGFGNPITPSKGWALRYKNLRTAPLEDLLFNETGFIPERRRFNYSYIRPKRGSFSERNPSVIFNLGEHRLFDEFNEIKADGLGELLRAERDTIDYKNNIESGQHNLNRRQLQSIIRQKEKDAFDALRQRYPYIDSIIDRKINEQNTQNKKMPGYKVDTPTFGGANADN